MWQRGLIRRVSEADWERAGVAGAYKIVSVDPTAGGMRPGLSWAVYQLWGVIPGPVTGPWGRRRAEAWILDEYRSQDPAHVQAATIRAKVRGWAIGSRLPGPVRRVVFEHSATGPALAATLAHDLRELRRVWEAATQRAGRDLAGSPELAALAVFPEVATRLTGSLSKERRSRLVWPFFERGIVRVADFPGAEHTIDELAAAGQGVSDRHDAAAQAVLDMEERGEIALEEAARA